MLESCSFRLSKQDSNIVAPFIPFPVCIALGCNVPYFVFPFVSYFPPDISLRGLWYVSHTAPLASALPCCSYPPSGSHGAITSRRPVVRTAVKYRRLARGRLFGTSLPCRHFLTSSPIQSLPSCTHKTGERNRKGKIFIRVSH